MEKSPVSLLVPFYFFLLGLLILFSLILLVQGVTGAGRNDSVTNMLFIMTGLTGLVSTFYMIRRYQLSVQKTLKERKIVVLTVEECSKCSYKAVRPFREGDYVYGYGEECPRCPKSLGDTGVENRMVITAIYLEGGRQEERY
ncbi:MAG: hypothetical protein FGF48_08520 [Candidatus Brockarchaeota archaeon]|nr:hypothetical protein [Candidatus Brockarchaeota archaeon]